jgi:peptide/nickel transport system substrate-binding protein
MKQRRLFLLVGLVLASVLVLGASSTGSAGTKATPKPGGTMVFGAEQEPPCLMGLLAGCNNTWTAWIANNPVIYPAYVEKPDFSFVPGLIDKATVVSQKPFTLLWHINAKAVWSDGVPVTADDLIYSEQVQTDSKLELAQTSGYDQIVKSIKVNSKTVKFVFKKPYAAWKTLFGGGQILPQHALAGSDISTVWNDNVNNPKTNKPIGDGPYLVTNYTKGQSITLTRNPKWWGPHKPYLDKVIFKFVTNTDSEIQAIRGGEVDAIYPQPQLQLADLKNTSGLKIQTHSGTTLEHIDFNAGKKGMPLVSAPWFRQAIAYSIDRTALVKQLYGTISPGLPVAQNLTYTSNQKEYVPHFQIYKYSPAKVAAIMKAHKCTKGGDGIFTCNGTRASIKFSTTAGNKLRELGQEIMQAQAKAAGIEFTIANQPSSLLFPALASNDYEMTDFAWVTTGDPAGQVDIYGCGGGSNWKAYCSTKVTNLLKASDAELDPTKRAADVNAADAVMALNVPTVPLFQKPTYLVYKSKLQNMIDNSSLFGPTWNIQDWWISG